MQNLTGFIHLQYSAFKWNFNHFTVGISVFCTSVVHNLGPQGVDFDAATDKKAIFKIEGIGKDWAHNVDNEHENYDYLSTSSHSVFA